MGLVGGQWQTAAAVGGKRVSGTGRYIVTNWLHSLAAARARHQGEGPSVRGGDESRSFDEAAGLHAQCARMYLRASVAGMACDGVG